jgi:hypothetical protein
MKLGISVNFQSSRADILALDRAPMSFRDDISPAVFLNAWSRSDVEPS